MRYEIALVFPELSAETFRVLYLERNEMYHKTPADPIDNDLTFDDILPIDIGVKNAVKKPCTVDDVAKMKVQRFLHWGTMEDIVNSSFQYVVEGYMIWRFELEGNLPTGIFNELAERGFEFFVYWLTSIGRYDVKVLEWGKLVYSPESRSSVAINDRETIIEVNEIVLNSPPVFPTDRLSEQYRDAIYQSLVKYSEIIERDILKYPCDGKARIYQTTDIHFNTALGRHKKLEELIQRLVAGKPSFIREDSWEIDLRIDRVICSLSAMERGSDKRLYTNFLYLCRSLIKYALENLRSSQ